jgi:GH15 family glucan-1,4-alpha-glucosidase
VSDPLERYALIGDAGTAALVGDRGAIDWLCLPRFDSDPIFARLLDPAAGHFSVAPSVPFTSTRRYVEDTAVLATTFRTSIGRATVYDFFAARTVPSKRRDLTPFRALIRRLHGEAGVVPFVAEVAPRDAFGGGRYRIRAHGGALSADRGAGSLLVRSPAAWTVGDGLATTSFDVRPGETVAVTAAYAGRDVGVLPYGPAATEAAYEETVAFWRRWMARCSPVGPHPDAVRRSAVVLKLLTFAPSGGIVAAPTTSLPETPGRGRNWDYRYVWVRDASWTAEALSSVGYEDEARAYLTWAINAMRTSRPRIDSLYTVYGSTSISKREIPQLRGYDDARPVRKGNAAVGQRQLDNWGHLVEVAYGWAHARGGLDRETWSAISALVRFVAEHWREPDHGIWEIRSEPRQYVHSKAMGWVALDRGVRLAREFGLRAPLDVWRRERERVRSAVLERGVDPDTGSFVQSFGSTDVDASLLLLGRTGIVPPSDGRILRTIDAVRDRLGRGELVYRYRRSDGIEGDEGAFLACSFWLAEALAAAGRVDEAREVFVSACRRSNDVGLLPEEIDPTSGAFLGNFPQALSHIAVISAAAAIERAGSGERPSAA